MPENINLFKGGMQGDSTGLNKNHSFRIYMQINPSGEIEVKTVQNYGGAYGHTAAAEICIPYDAPNGTQFFMTASSHYATDGVGSGSCSLTETYP